MTVQQLTPPLHLVDQPQAAVVLKAALEDNSVAHSYLFTGPEGVGKAAAARGFAAELIAQGQEDPLEAKGRVERGVHPDLSWVVPQGAHEILVDDIRSKVIEEIQRQPFEAKRRVFVVVEADLMNDEASNALLKTLEEPPPYARIVLTSSEPERLLDTVRSRCQRVSFRPLSKERIMAMLADEGVPADQAVIAAKLASGRLELARKLASLEGVALRKLVVDTFTALFKAESVAERPWLALLEYASQAGDLAEQELTAKLEEELEFTAKGRDSQALKRDYKQSGQRASRRQRTHTLVLELDLLTTLFRDLIAVSEDRPELLLNSDLLQTYGALKLPSIDSLVTAADLCEELKTRLRSNVAEELALDALFYRLRDCLVD